VDSSAWGPTTIATGFAYVVGYASVSFFASTLDVSAADVGLDLRDYLLLTGLTALSWVPVLVATVLWAWVTNREHRRRLWQVVAADVGVVAAVGAMAAAGLVTSGGNFYVGVLLPYVLLLGIVITGIVVQSRLRTRYMALAAVALIAIATPISTLVGSRDWANSLLKDAEANAPPGEGPFPIRLVLQPEIGSATIESGVRTAAACVLRVSDRVFLGTDAVVVRDVTSFTTYEASMDSECADLDSVPWST
jgi:hypothetical protein